MSKDRNVARSARKLGLRVDENGNEYFRRRYGAIDMHVSGPGGLLAVATEDGGTRPADRADIDRLERSGAAMAIERVVPDGMTNEGPIRHVDVITMRPAPTPDEVVEMMTPVPWIGSAGGGERHGPPSPQEQADHIASILAFETVINPSLSARGAYRYYREGLDDMNEGHRTARIEPMSVCDFGRLVAVAGFIMDSEDEPPAGVTIH